jgi:hypothetical protein
MGEEEMIEVRKDEERIKIYFPYNSDYIAKIQNGYFQAKIRKSI